MDRMDAIRMLGLEDRSSTEEMLRSMEDKVFIIKHKLLFGYLVPQLAGKRYEDLKRIQDAMYALGLKDQMKDEPLDPQKEAFVPGMEKKRAWDLLDVGDGMIGMIREYERKSGAIKLEFSSARLPGKAGVAIKEWSTLQKAYHRVVHEYLSGVMDEAVKDPDLLDHEVSIKGQRDSGVLIKSLEGLSKKGVGSEEPKKFQDELRNILWKNDSELRKELYPLLTEGKRVNKLYHLKKVRT